MIFRPGLSPGFCTMRSAWKFTGRILVGPHTRAMGRGLFELRLKAAEGIARVFYCTVVERRIVMLHQFIKKSERTPRKELEIALKRMKEVKDA